MLHPLLRRVYDRLTLRGAPTSNGNTKSNTTGHVAAEHRLRNRLNFDFGSALVYIVALNGFSALKVLLILWVNFKIATALPRNAIPATTWVFNISILFANELAQGYRYSVMSEALVPFFSPAADWGSSWILMAA